MNEVVETKWKCLGASHLSNELISISPKTNKFTAMRHTADARYIRRATQISSRALPQSITGMQAPG